MGWKAVGDDALTSCIQELRRALGDEARQPRFIETQHRRGYRWIVPVVSTMAGTQAGSSEPARLFGRQKEMSELWRRFDMAQAGQRQFVLVTGEARHWKDGTGRLFHRGHLKGK